MTLYRSLDYRLCFEKQTELEAAKIRKQQTGFVHAIPVAANYQEEFRLLFYEETSAPNMIRIKFSFIPNLLIFYPFSVQKRTLGKEDAKISYLIPMFNIVVAPAPPPPHLLTSPQGKRSISGM